MIMQKRTIKDAKAGDRIRIPIDDGRYLTMDRDGKYLAKKQWVEVFVVEKADSFGNVFIAWDSKSQLIANVGYLNIKGSEHEKEYPALDRYINVNSEMPCLFLPKKSSNPGFLLALIGAGAALSQLTSTSKEQQIVGERHAS